MKERELARLFFREVYRIIQDNQFVSARKVTALYQLLGLVFLEVTKDEQLQFTTLFARITYASQRAGLSRQQQFYIHYFRKQALQSIEGKLESEEVYRLGIRVLTDVIKLLFKADVPAELEDVLPGEEVFPQPSREIESFRERVRVVVTADDPEKECLLGTDEEKTEKEICIKYNIPDRNENFFPTIKSIRKVFSFPVTLNLIDVEIDKSGLYCPRAIVIEPDYLVDVTAVSECFNGNGLFLEGYLLKKFLPFVSSIPLMVGNIANFFLDELMTDPGQTFKMLFPKVFRLNPLAFALMGDREVREVMQKAQKHFINLKQMVLEGFAKKEIQKEACFLEPSFYAEAYGLQGRLDLFEPSNIKGRSSIVELKSGKPFRPNVYGLSNNHFTQTLLYDLMVRSIFGKKMEPVNYILYSGQEDNILRFAPSVKAQQMEALQARNYLVAMEWALIKAFEQSQGADSSLLRRLDPAVHPNVKGFLHQGLKQFSEVYRRLSPLERAYFIAFASFIAREQKLAKTGVQGLDKINGLAALWLHSFPEKEQQFEIVSHLVVAENRAGEEEPVVVFSKTEQTNPLANFRKGDIAVLYPFKERYTNVLHNQIFKCTILEITDETVSIRLRYRQFNHSLFEKEKFWNIEHDLLDSSFVGMYRQLFAFMSAPKSKRALLFTQKAPEKGLDFPLYVPQELTKEQQNLFKKIIAAKDYFLLWGPPGTGKTSMMLKNIVGYLWQHTEEDVLLLAYTNRAVDEICEAIESYHPDLKYEYIRIGSRFACNDAYQHSLLEEKAADINNRKELKALIKNHRIYVATVSSIGGKQELLQLKKFKRVIIDEASQILEPMLVGLLPQFEQFILIGDHKQLPAVVVQNEKHSKVQRPDLNAIGLNDLRDSLFERLFRKAEKAEWKWAYGRLSHQGRMHAEIMEFPNTHFYKKGLKILPNEISLFRKQIKLLDYQLPKNAHPIDQSIAQNRVLFIPTPADNRLSSGKTNAFEANVVKLLVERFRTIYKTNGLAINDHSIGIITPYRAQIAQIRKVLQEHDINCKGLTIDTVERYQGGARDVIILSLCTNRQHQLESLVNLSDEGVDRKLNVALTRARNHLVLIGNPELLCENALYRDFIEKYQINEAKHRGLFGF